MEIKELNISEVEEIYHHYVVNDFHLDEVKPWIVLEIMMERKIYSCFGLYEGKGLCGYAFFSRAKDGNYLLLDYYAISQRFRSEGFGTTFLTMLHDYFKEEGLDGIILETEHLDHARSEEDAVIRKRRIAFYEKNGLRHVNIFSKVNHVEYMIMVMPICKNDSDGALFSQLKAIYQTMFPEDYYDQCVEVLKMT